MIKEIITCPFVFRWWLFDGMWLNDPNYKPPKVISLDTETTSLKYIDLDIVGFSLCDGRRACYVDVRNKYRTQLLNILAYYLAEYDPLVIMHNAPFDLMVLRKVGVI